MKNKKETKVKASKKRELTKTEKFVKFLDNNRKIIYGFVGGALVTAIVATIIWPDRIATLKDGTQPVAEIKGEKITADILYEDMKDYYSVSLLLDRIDNMLLSEMYEDTDEMKIELEEEAQNYYSQYEKFYQMSKEEFLAQNGFNSHEKFIDFLRLKYLRNEYYEEYVESIISENEINDFYEKSVYGDIDSKHMLVTTDEERTDSEAKELAKEIIAKLNEGKTFDEVKEEYKDSITFEELGYQAFNASIEENYMNALKNLENEKYTTEPVKTSYGYHVIYRIAQKEKPSLEEVKDAIIDEIATDKKAEDQTLSTKALISLRDKNEFTFYDSVMENKYNQYKKSIEK